MKKIVAIAPMMAYTDRHYRYLMRLISKNITLYTEMVHARAILHGDRQYLLNYSTSEHPLALQVGGSNPDELAKCALIAADFGFDEINLNVGCPSERVQQGQFGACLFKQPEHVAKIVHAMKSVTQIPVTVKTRIAVDECDDYQYLFNFINQVSLAGCRRFIIHARKAWLKGLNPKQNREIPPLNYSWVYQLKSDFPQLEIIINGGIKELNEIRSHLFLVDGVMIGREAYANPYLFANFDQEFFDEQEPAKTRQAIIKEYANYVADQLERKVPLRSLIKPVIGLFQGQAGAKIWRRYLTEHISVGEARILEQAFEAMGNV